MKRIIDGRLYDDQFMNDVGSRSFDAKDPVTGEIHTYREELKREFTLKPGHTVEDTWVEGGYGRRIVKDNCDLTKGQFVLKVARGYGDGIFVLLTDDAARRWFEEWCPDEVDRYEEVFGRPKGPWAGDGAVRLVEKAERQISSMRWDKERAEERAVKAEAEIAQLKAKLEALSKPAEPEV